jgi:hypothetical protein
VKEIIFTEMRGGRNIEQDLWRLAFGVWRQKIDKANTTRNEHWSLSACMIHDPRRLHDTKENLSNQFGEQ